MKRIAKLGFLIATTLVLSTGCKKTFDINPQDQLDESQAYQSVYDADAAIVGIYGKFMGLAETYIVLNELRGDLLNYTNNADENLRQISTHSVTAGNKYVNPRPFYELIVNCNDALANFQMMLQKNRMN
ncbi:MAG: RagB/SusD family protein, partial [Pedobacter sp.]